MDDHSKRRFENRVKSMIVKGISIFGLSCLLYAIYEISRYPLSFNDFSDSLIILVFFTLIFPKSVTLPSGSVWRPAIGFIIFSAFVFPFSDTVILIFLGMILSNFRRKNKRTNVFLSFGHLMLGILSIKFVIMFFSPGRELTHLPGFYCILVGLIAHFAVNRFVSAVIVSYRKRKPLTEQIKLIKNDLNWGYVSTYLVSMYMIYMHLAYNDWKILLVSIFLLYSIYFSVVYFKKANDLKKIYLTDALTGADNRTSWEDFKLKFLTNGNSGTFILVDLDNFKAVNDNWGHDIGDKILCETVTCLKEIANPSRVFRYGGDEFILYLPHHKDEQLAVQQTIVQSVNCKNNEWLQRDFQVSMSFGMEFVSTKYANLDQLFINIDKQMYKDKYRRKQTQNGRYSSSLVKHVMR